MRTALTLTLAIAAALATVHAEAADETRSLAPFSSVSSSGTANVRIEVGKAQSITVSGDDALVRDVLTEVVGIQLKIRTHHNTVEIGGHNQGVRVTITVPRLTAFEMGGAGESTITHMSGDSLDVSFGGAGSLTADPKTVHTSGGGLGGIARAK